jgi:serine protease Do
LRTAAGLLNVQRLQGKWHGLVTEAADDFGGPLRVVKVESASPADAAGVQPGDELVQVGAAPVTRPLDLERALLDRPLGEALALRIRRDGQPVHLDLALAAYRGRNSVSRVAANATNDLDAAVWNVFGLKLSEEPRSTFARRNTKYRGGMRVEDVRTDSPAARQGILAGDVLVGMHGWETASVQDIQYIVSRPELGEMGRMKFYLLRGQNTLYQGFLNVPPDAARPASRR